MIKIVLVVYSLFLFVKSYLNIQNLKFSKFIIFFFYLSVLLLFLGDVFDHNILYKVSIGANLGAWLAISILLIVKDVNKKKNQVMWRIPLIGTLLAYHFIQEDFSYILLAGEILVFSIFFLKRELYNYAFRQQFKILILSIIMAIAFNYELNFFKLSFLLILSLKSQIINGLILKVKLLEE